MNKTVDNLIAKAENRETAKTICSGELIMKNRVKLSSLIVAVAFLFVLATAVSAQKPKLGGYKEVDASTADVQAAAAFAVTTRSEKTEKEMELVDVLKAEKQVVAGTNYRMCLKVDSEAGEGQDYVTIFVQTVVYVDLKGNKKLTSWAISDCAGEDDG